MKLFTIIIPSSIILILLFMSQSAANPIHSGFTQIKGQYEQSKFILKVWYPTETTPQDVSLGYFKMKIAQSAAIQKGKHGLVILSHGDGGSDLGHRNLGLYLSKQGYIVVSFMHPHNNYMQNSYSRTTENWIHRPKHIKTALDMMEQSEFKSSIDPNRIFIIGFSAGAYTATAVIGGKVDVTNIKKHCMKDGQADAEFCRPAKNVKNPSWPREIPIFQEKDNRIKAAVILAPMGVLFYGDNMLDDIRIPVLLIGGEKDDVLPRKFHAEYIARNIKQATYEVMPGAGHYSFITPFPPQLKGMVDGADVDPKGFDRHAFQKKLEKRILKFLDAQR